MVIDCKNSNRTAGLHKSFTYLCGRVGETKNALLPTCVFRRLLLPESLIQFLSRHYGGSITPTARRCAVHVRAFLAIPSDCAGHPVPGLPCQSRVHHREYVSETASDRT